MHVESRLHLEFHVRHDDSHPASAAYIRHCLLRVHAGNSVLQLEEELAAIGGAFRHFAYLETVVLETGGGVEPETAELLLEALRGACSVEVRHRSCSESYAAARLAKESPSPVTSTDLQSPFWYLQRWKSLHGPW